MRDCRISDRWTLNGHRVIILENELVRVTVLVEQGARLHEFVYKPLDRDFFWHNPRIEPRTPVFQADVDAWLSGGMDEAIPTGHASTYRGERYPYLGEVWSLAWDYDITRRAPEEVEVHMWRHTPISPLRYVGALEAWTGYPQQLHAAVEHGAYATLPANGVLECETALVAYTGVTGVGHLGMDGSAAPAG